MGYSPVLEIGVIIVGAVIGAVGFVPLIVGLHLARKAMGIGSLGEAGALLLGFLVSIIMLALALFAGVMLIRDQIMAYALAVAAGLSLMAIGYGIYSFVSRK